MVLGVTVWMASGQFDREERRQSEPAKQEQHVLVETRASRAQPVERYSTAYGSVEASRRAAVKAETAGRVSEIAVREGERVRTGQLLVQLSLEARGAQLEEAEAQLKKLEQDLDNAQKLVRRGAVAAQREREIRVQVATARAAIARIKEEITDTAIEAPFGGIINDVAIEPGEYVSTGAELATIIDNDPLRVSVQIPQQTIARIERGAEADVTFATGRKARGRICFISAAANPETRTFEVEIRVANPDSRTPSRISADARIPIGEAMAHGVSPAIFSLGANGQLGVKIVDGGRVSFRGVDIVRSEAGKVWVAGLPKDAQLIVRGQGFVRDGDLVRTTPAREDSGSASSGARLGDSNPMATTGKVPRGHDRPRADPDAALPPCEDRAQPPIPSSAEADEPASAAAARARP
jgi:multidrug efflux system membrane fusion protein